jgi:hypothetical protein
MQWRTWQINFEMYNGEFNINGFVRILAEGEAFAATKLTVTRQFGSYCVSAALQTITRPRMLTWQSTTARLILPLSFESLRRFHPNVAAPIRPPTAVSKPLGA